MNDKELKAFHENCKIVDIHCHPSLKMHLFGAHFIERNNPDHPQRSTGFDPFTTQVTYPKMVSGGMDVILSSIYLPEYGFLEFSDTVCLLKPLLSLFFDRVVSGVEKIGDPSYAYLQTKDILKNFEDQVNKINDTYKYIRIPKNVAEFENALAIDSKIVLHSIEGGHSLGRFNSGSAPMIERIDSFLDEGVCLMTVGHFFRNDITESVIGFPPSMSNLMNFKYSYDNEKGLYEKGPDVISHMLDKGMIVDMVHCTREARKEIFKINDDRGDNKRPLVFSHTGLEFFTSMHDIQLNVTDDEIKKIQMCNGTIGIIFNNYLLTGYEDPSGSNTRFGIQSIVDSIQHVKHVTGSYDNVSIGTDLDGFTDPPDDIPDILDMPKITKALLEVGISEEDIRKILGENAIRVLREGWR
ncbi:MAG: membrane dipeptidase [Bacteroidetes bacterium]|nr:membrane dipeptidase [Bacteroidota bacterium]